jgi:hypothetical protein
MLASQLIPKYLKHFPQKTAPAIDALLDLCEEELIDVFLILFLIIRSEFQQLEFFR